jgi:hypothetical protein
MNAPGLPAGGGWWPCRLLWPALFDANGRLGPICRGTPGVDSGLQRYRHDRCMQRLADSLTYAMDGYLSNVPATTIGRLSMGKRS